jgi:hypothetical protein
MKVLTREVEPFEIVPIEVAAGNFGLTDKGLSRYAAIQSGEIAGQRFPRLPTGPDDRPVAACTPQHDRVTLFGDFPLKGLRIGDGGPIQFRDFV